MEVLRGTGAYAHLEGHGRVAIVDRDHHGVADRAEGLVDLDRESMNKPIVSLTLLGTPPSSPN